jgi:hypothetical protein
LPGSRATTVAATRFSSAQATPSLACKDIPSSGKRT